MGRSDGSEETTHEAHLGSSPCNLRISILCHNCQVTQEFVLPDPLRLGNPPPSSTQRMSCGPWAQLGDNIPAGQTLPSGSDLTPCWLQDSALVEGWIISTQSYIWYLQHHHWPNHSTTTQRSHQAQTSPRSNNSCLKPGLRTQSF